MKFTMKIFLIINYYLIAVGVTSANQIFTRVSKIRNQSQGIMKITQLKTELVHLQGTNQQS